MLNINKNYMNYIKEELKKDKYLVIRYLPTEEEKEYLKSFNILTEIVIITRKCLFLDLTYDVEYCMYYLKK